jgi:glycosyltransferase involved in cell wall biosynthesis
MHYLVQEVARLPEPRPFLVMLGAMDGSTDEILRLATELLGSRGFAARSVPYRSVGAYSRAADCFALASLEEGFGRVYLEALMHGLPVLAHRHPVIEYVLGGCGIVADLRADGTLTSLLASALARPPGVVDMRRRWRSVAERFSWQTLGPRYAKMFRSVAHADLPGKST